MVGLLGVGSVSPVLTNSGETQIPKQQTKYDHSCSTDHRGKSYQAAPEETRLDYDDDDALRVSKRYWAG